MRPVGVLLLCCLAIQSAFADETNLTFAVDGVTYSNATFGTVTPSSVTIFYRTGIATIPLEKLSPDLQKQFGYDPDKARSYEAQKSAARAREVEAARKAAELEVRVRRANKVSARIAQVVNDGLLVNLKHWQAYASLIGYKTYYTVGCGPEQDWSDTVFLSGDPNFRARAENDTMLLLVERVGTYSFKDTTGAERQVPRYDYLGTWELDPHADSHNPQMTIIVHYAGRTQVIPF